MSPFTKEEMIIMHKLMNHPVLNKLSAESLLALIDFISHEVFDQHVEWCAYTHSNDLENGMPEPEYSQPSKQYRKTVVAV